MKRANKEILMRLRKTIASINFQLNEIPKMMEEIENSSLSEQILDIVKEELDLNKKEPIPENTPLGTMTSGFADFPCLLMALENKMEVKIREDEILPESTIENLLSIIMERI